MHTDKPVDEKDKFLEDAPEKKIQHPIAPWREGSYEHVKGTAYADLKEEPLPVKKLREQFPGEFLAYQGYRGDACVLIRPGRIVEILKFLRDDPECAFDLMRDLFAMDDLKTEARCKEFADAGVPEARFEMIYLLCSLRFRHELRLRVPLADKNSQIDSVISVYPCADWFEREVWDMYGIEVMGHPNLRRLLNHEGFVGHPLRKDYPINRRHNFTTPTDL